MVFVSRTTLVVSGTGCVAPSVRGHDQSAWDAGPLGHGPMGRVRRGCVPVVAPYGELRRRPAEEDRAGRAGWGDCRRPHLWCRLLLGKAGPRIGPRLPGGGLALEHLRLRPG